MKKCVVRVFIGFCTEISAIAKKIFDRTAFSFKELFQTSCAETKMKREYLMLSFCLC